MFHDVDGRACTLKIVADHSQCSYVSSCRDIKEKELTNVLNIVADSSHWLCYVSSIKKVFLSAGEFFGGSTVNLE